MAGELGLVPKTHTTDFLASQLKKRKKTRENDKRKICRTAIGLKRKCSCCGPWHPDSSMIIRFPCCRSITDRYRKQLAKTMSFDEKSRQLIWGPKLKSHPVPSGSWNETVVLPVGPLSLLIVHCPLGSIYEYPQGTGVSPATGLQKPVTTRNDLLTVIIAALLLLHVIYTSHFPSRGRELSLRWEHTPDPRPAYWLILLFMNKK